MLKNKFFVINYNCCLISVSILLLTKYWLAEVLVYLRLKLNLNFATFHLTTTNFPQLFLGHFTYRFPHGKVKVEMYDTDCIELSKHWIW